MQLTLQTTKLKEMVSRAIKGASCNKLIPLTNYMSLSLTKNTLMLITTDGTNYLYIRENKVEGEDVSITVPVEIFSRLISKLTCETVTLNINNEEYTLEIVGNGSYMIELPSEEELMNYPHPMQSFKIKKTAEITLSTIQTILTTAKPALATSELGVPHYMGYYVGDRVVATDTDKICNIGISIFDNPKLISAEQMNLLSVMQAEKIEVEEKDNIMIYNSPDCIVYGPVMEGIEEFNIDKIKEFVDTEFENVCKLPKDSLIQLLDRLALFVDENDKNAIYLTFDKEGLQVSSAKSSGVEVISYLTDTEVKEFTCCIDIEMLRSQIKALVGDTIELYYGEDSAIKIVEGNTTQIIALLEDNRLDEAE